MKRLFTLLLVAVMLGVTHAAAQIITTSPAILQESSQNVVLTFNAASPLGNNGLANLPSSTAIYAHIGVITNKSKSTSDWKYTLTSWPAADGSNSASVNLAKNRFTYVKANTYTLTIGKIREYFGITDPSETVEKIAIVARTADGKREAKTASGGDILVDVHPEGFAFSFTADVASTVISKATTINFTAITSQAADITITVDGVSINSGKGVTALTARHNFAQRGYYNVKATAVAGGRTYTETISVAWPSPSPSANYPGGVPRMGAVDNPDGSVTFCLAAPGKTSAVIVPQWDDYNILEKNVMNYQDYNGNRYFWITVKGINDNAYHPYYFLVDGKYKVADPYAHLVLDCYSDKWIDPSVWPDMPAYPYDKIDGVMLAVYRHGLDNYSWSNFEIPDHGNLVIYEMLFRDFTGTDGEALGDGTVRQAIARIPYLKSLGINAVELMPIMEFNGNNSWGYNTNFYMAPDKAYGSPTDYKDFIEQCHRNGIAVILDIVFNQSDGLHPWYQLYDINSNPFYNATAPHSYSVLNDWNQGNALVQQQWTDALTYWMKNYNVDGFRFDLVKGLGDNNSYGSGTDNYNASRINRMKRLHKVITDIKPNGIHINEDLAGAQEEIELGNDGMLQWANINHNSCQFTMGFSEESSRGPLTTAFLATAYGNRPWGSTVAYAESHDEERMGFKNKSYGNGAVKTDEAVSYRRLGSLAAMMLLTPGPKMIWQFGELGADQTTKTGTENNTDPKIVLWNRLDHENPTKLMETYQALCHLRTHNAELFAKDAQFTVTGFTTSMSSNRIMRLTKGDREIMGFFNPNTSGGNRNVGAAATVLKPGNAQLIAASPGITPSLTGSGSSVGVSLPAGSFAIFATSNVNSVNYITIDSTDTTPTFSVSNGTISANGCDDVKVYSIDGCPRANHALPAGIYIAVAGQHTAKVAVR